MADDAARIAQLEADLRLVRDENAALRQGEATRDDEAKKRDRALEAALEQQTATAEVLRVIASSPMDLQAALDPIIEAAVRLCDASGGSLMQVRETDGLLARRA